MIYVWSRVGRIFTKVTILAMTMICLGASATLNAAPLTLAGALEIAYANSPDMKRAGYSLSASQHNELAQQAALKSQLSLTLTPYNFTRSRTFYSFRGQYSIEEQTTSTARFAIDQPIVWTDGTLSLSESVTYRDSKSSDNLSTDGTLYFNNLLLSFSQPIFTYNKVKMESERVRRDLQRSSLNFALQKLMIERDVTSQFLNLYRFQRSLQIAQERLNNATESLEIIQSKVDAGISAMEEFYQADLSQASSRASHENSRSQYENSMDNFKILLGMELDEEVEVLPDIQKEQIEVDLATAINHGLSYRMELRQRKMDIQDAMDNLTQAGSQDEFAGTVELSYGLSSDANNFEDLFKSNSKDHTIAVRLNVPLFDWGEKKHRMAASRTQVQRQELNEEDQRNRIVLEIREAYRTLQNQKTQIEIAEKNVRNAQLTYDINLDRYRNGDLSSKDISFYQEQLSTEQLNEVQALIDYQLSLLELKIRTLYDFKNGRSVLPIN
ncbi:MAG: TolC family protein [candidate division Zixibacteria bacterium]